MDKILTVPKESREFVMDPEVVEFVETPIAALERLGPPAQVMKTVSRFIEWRKASDVSPEGESRTFGLIYSDPDNTIPEEFRFRRVW